MPLKDKEARRLYDKIRRGSPSTNDLSRYAMLTGRPPPAAELSREKESRLKRDRERRKEAKERMTEAETRALSVQKRLYDRITYGRATEEDIAAYVKSGINQERLVRVPATLSEEQIEIRKSCQRMRGLLRRRSKNIKSNEVHLAKLLHNITHTTRWKQEKEQEAAVRKAKQVDGTKKYRVSLNQQELQRQQELDKLRHRIYRFSPEKSQVQLAALKERHSSLLKTANRPQLWRRKESLARRQQRLRRYSLYHRDWRHALSIVKASSYVEDLEKRIASFEIFLSKPAVDKCVYTGNYVHSTPYNELRNVGPSMCGGCRERIDMKYELWNDCYHSGMAKAPLVRKWFDDRGQDLLFKFHELGSR